MKINKYIVTLEDRNGFYIDTEVFAASIQDAKNAMLFTNELSDRGCRIVNIKESQTT